MKKIRLFQAVIFTGLMVILFLKPINASAGDSCPIRQDTNIVVYTGDGADPYVVGWTLNFFSWWKGGDATINTIKLNASEIKHDCILKDYPKLRLYYQPGGNAYFQQKALSFAGKNRIKDFIQAGGKYVGVCAGFYYAATGYFWEDVWYEHTNLLGLIPANEGSVFDIARFPAMAKTSMSNGNNMLYFGGPTYGYEYTKAESNPGRILLTYTVPIAVNGLVAATRTDSMLLMSIHPEAYNNGLTNGVTFTESEITANYRWFAGQINRLLGTEFNIPKSAPQVK